MVKRTLGLNFLPNITTVSPASGQRRPHQRPSTARPQPLLGPRPPGPRAPLSNHSRFRRLGAQYQTPCRRHRGRLQQEEERTAKLLSVICHHRPDSPSLRLPSSSRQCARQQRRHRLRLADMDNRLPREMVSRDLVHGLLPRLAPGSSPPPGAVEPGEPAARSCGLPPERGGGPFGSNRRLCRIVRLPCVIIASVICKEAEDAINDHAQIRKGLTGEPRTVTHRIGCGFRLGHPFANRKRTTARHQGKLVHALGWPAGCSGGE